MLMTHKPATAAIRYRSLQQFFKWLVNEEEIGESPMAKMKPAKVILPTRARPAAGGPATHVHPVLRLDEPRGQRGAVSTQLLCAGGPPRL